MDREKSDWTQIPTLLHVRAREQSTATSGLFMSLMQTGVDCLRLNDMSVEGVDFHCSSIIEHLLKDDELVNLSSDLLILSDDDDFPDAAQERREYLGKIWKSCMWHYSSGVNHRRSLIQTPVVDGSKTRLKKHENLWNSLAAEKARAFQQKYIQDRLCQVSC